MQSKLLYHYCKLSTAIESILPNKQLLLNPVGRTNDPRENKSFVFAASGMNIPDAVAIQDRHSEISQEIRKGCKMLCLSGNRGSYFGYELSRMWAMYGDNHRGVCIGLNAEGFINENQDKIRPELFKQVTYFPLDVERRNPHRQIDYDRIEQVGLEKYIKDEFRRENIDHLFFKKNAEWESEQEIRLVYFSDNKKNEYCQIEKSLEAIYLGVDFNKYYLPAIRANAQDVDIYNLEYADVRLADRVIRH